MFLSILGFIGKVLGSVNTIGSILSIFGVEIPEKVKAVVPLVSDLMRRAEEAKGDGQGPIKKAAVEAAANAFVSVMATASTGGQKETYEGITPEAVSSLIDGIASLANSFAEKPVFDDTQFETMKQGG